MAKIDKWLEAEGLLSISKWAQEGLTNEGIAINMGISTRTLQGWLKAHPPIVDALEEGRELSMKKKLNDLRIEFNIEQALLKRASNGDMNALTIYLKRKNFF